MRITEVCTFSANSHFVFHMSSFKLIIHTICRNIIYLWSISLPKINLLIKIFLYFYEICLWLKKSNIASLIHLSVNSVPLGWMVKLTCGRQFVGIIGRTGNHLKCITVRNLEMQMLRKRAIRIWDMKGENHQTQVYKSLYFLLLIMYPPHVVNYNIQNQTTNLYLQYWICWMVQQPLWNVPLLLLSYIITLLIHLLLFSFIIITCLTFVFSHGCSFLFLSQILLYSKFAVIVHEIIKIVISSKAKSFFSTLSISISISPSLNQTTIMPSRGF